MSRWIRTGRRRLTDGRFLRTYQDELLVSEGVTATWEWIEMVDAVRVVAIDPQGRVAVVEDQFYLQDRRMILVPGGGVDRDESPEAAAKRELEEETGWRAGSVEPLGVIDPLPSATPARTHLFLARGLTPGRLAREPSEAGMTLHWWSLAEAVAATRAGAVTEAGSVAALLLAAAREPGTGEEGAREQGGGESGEGRS